MGRNRLTIGCVAGGFKGLAGYAREIMARAMRKTQKIYYGAGGKN